MMTICVFQPLHPVMLCASGTGVMWDPTAWQWLVLESVSKCGLNYRGERVDATDEASQYSTQCGELKTMKFLGSAKIVSNRS